MVEGRGLGESMLEGGFRGGCSVGVEGSEMVAKAAEMGEARIGEGGVVGEVVIIGLVGA